MMDQFTLESALSALEALGVTGATPFVVQWILDWRDSTKPELTRFDKMILSVVVGMVLGVILGFRVGSLEPEWLVTNGMQAHFWWTAVVILVQGGVAGAFATAGVSLAGNLLKKARPEQAQVTVVNTGMDMGTGADKVPSDQE